MSPWLNVKPNSSVNTVKGDSCFPVKASVITEVRRPLGVWWGKRKIRMVTITAFKRKMDISFLQESIKMTTGINFDILSTFIISWIMHGLWLVLNYHFPEDRRMKNVTIDNFFAFLPCKTNRFHVAVCLYNRSWRTSQCSNNICNTLFYASWATFFVPTTF